VLAVDLPMEPVGVKATMQQVGDLFVGELGLAVVVRREIAVLVLADAVEVVGDKERNSFRPDSAVDANEGLTPATPTHRRKQPGATSPREVVTGWPMIQGRGREQGGHLPGATASTEELRHHHFEVAMSGPARDHRHLAGDHEAAPNLWAGAD
jgi:hypothetical protein